MPPIAALTSATGEGKIAPIPGSSDPAFRGDPARYNPEELLVGALANCHMLWVLHLCSDAGIVVTEYADEAWGEMVEHRRWLGRNDAGGAAAAHADHRPGRAAEVAAIHDRAHAVCCLARSVRFPVGHEPEVLIDAGASA